MTSGTLGSSLLLVFLAGLAFAGAGFAQTGPEPPLPDATEVPAAEISVGDYEVVSIAADGSLMVLGPLGGGRSPASFAVTAGEREAVRLKYAPGDRVRAVVSGASLLGIQPRLVPVARRAVWTGIVVGLAFLAGTHLLLRATGRSVLDLLRGKDGRYSNSQFQAALWFGVLMLLYVTSIVVRWMASGGALWRGPEIPQNLLLLSGLSAISFVGAKTITESKIQKAMDKIESSQVGRPPGPPPGAMDDAVAPARAVNLRREAERRVKPTGKAQFPGDLLCDDRGHPDFGDTQMFLITIVAVGAYLAQGIEWLRSVEQVAVTSLPDVSSTILAAFGLGQGAYLVKKGVGSGEGG